MKEESELINIEGDYRGVERHWTQLLSSLTINGGAVHGRLVSSPNRSVKQ